MHNAITYRLMQNVSLPRGFGIKDVFIYSSDSLKKHFEIPFLRIDRYESILFRTGGMLYHMAGLGTPFGVDKNTLFVVVPDGEDGDGIERAVKKILLGYLKINSLKRDVRVIGMQNQQLHLL